VAEAVLRAHRELKAQGYGLLIHDGNHPWYVTKIFWDATPDDKKIFVADPAEGSKHNRGCAVDLSLYDLKTGREVKMPSGYDEMTDRALPTTPVARPRSALAVPFCAKPWKNRISRLTPRSGGTSTIGIGNSTQS
jgi:zinc D-Ala-D-Ala dipeptidase